MLYPINQIQPMVTYLQKHNDNVIYRELEGNHQMSYLEDETERLIAFIHEERTPTNQNMSWETSDLAMQSSGWVSITKIDTINSIPKPWHKPYQLRVFNNKADFGVKYDYAYQGIGLKVSGFKSDTCTAKHIGLKKDDIAVMM